MASAISMELARKSELFYETRLKTQLEASHPNAFVAIEPESGDYQLGTTMTEAMDAARSRHPDRLVYVMRVGQSAAVHIG